MDTSYYTMGGSPVVVPKGEWSAIRLIVIDVDGTLTDSGIYYDDNGNEMKKFSTRDAAGFFAAKVCGIETMILTGRECAATTRRMKELQVDYLIQDVRNKASYLKGFMLNHGLEREHVAYIGDDLNDYECMKLCGFVGCPNDSVEEISNIANYKSMQNGGNGAVRDIIRYLLIDRKQWDSAITSCYRIKN